MIKDLLHAATVVWSQKGNEMKGKRKRNDKKAPSLAIRNVYCIAHWSVNSFAAFSHNANEQ